MTPRLKSSEQGVGTMLMAALYGLLLVGSQMLLGSVAEEKTNRVAEMLAAIGRPRDFLAGKIAAACALGLSQIFIWGGIGAVTFLTTAHTLTERLATMPTPSQDIARVLPPLGPTLETIGIFLILAPLSYLQFASLYTAAASLISRPEDITTVATPLAIPVAISILSGIYSSEHGHSTAAAVLSYVPLISTFAMIGRVSNGAASAIDIISVFGFQLAITSATLEIAARIYHVGLTTYGSYPSIGRILKMMKQA